MERLQKDLSLARLTLLKRIAAATMNDTWAGSLNDPHDLLGNLERGGFIVSRLDKLGQPCYQATEFGMEYVLMY